MALTSVQACVLLYCRPGFEGECAQEIAAATAAANLPGHVRAEPLSGFVEYRLHDGVSVQALQHLADWRRLIFARQCLFSFARVEALQRADRLTPIIAALTARGERYHDAWVEAPETDAGKELAAFC